MRCLCPGRPMLLSCEVLGTLRANGSKLQGREICVCVLCGNDNQSPCSSGATGRVTDTAGGGSSAPHTLQSQLVKVLCFLCLL